MKRIVHLSNLSISQDTTLDDLKSLRTAIIVEKPDLLAVSGSITRRGDKPSFERARDWLNAFDIPFTALHGSSDLPSFNLWHRFFDPVQNMRDFISPIEESIHEDKDCFILGLNTVRPYLWGFKTSNGAVSQTQIQNAHNQFRYAPDQAWRILMTHHSLIATGKPRGGSIIWGAQDLLKALEDQKIDLILSSHPYKSSVHEHKTPEIDSPMIVETAPAALHYTLITLHQDHAQIDLKSHSSGETTATLETHYRWRPLSDDAVIEQEQRQS
jgi:3',5'-cyclic AMP phosphodiesterase CpdA